MRTPASCSVCGVMGHTRRTCLVARLRSQGGSDYTQEEEERVKAHLRQQFENSNTGIRWARYQREEAERRERAAQRHRDRMRELNAAREAEVVRQRAARAEQPLLIPSDLSHTFPQIQSWARRAEREVRNAMAEQQARPRSLSLKMMSDFQQNYTVDTECSICYEKIPNIGLPCKHTFCGECTVKFAQKSRSCPLCRCQFREINICRNIEPEDFNKISAENKIVNIKIIEICQLTGKSTIVSNFPFEGIDI